MSDREIRTGRVGLAAAAIALTVIGAVAVVMAWMRSHPLPPPRPMPAVPGPVLQGAPQADLRAAQAEQRRRLHGLGWVDAERGIAHIPIEAAMALQAARASEAGR